MSQVWMVKTKKGNRWKARIHHNGKKLTITGETKSEVENRIAAIRIRRRDERLGLAALAAPKNISYDDLCEKVLGMYPHRERSKTTLTDRLHYSRRTFGKTLVRDLTPDAIQTWLMGLSWTRKGREGRPFSPTTKRYALNAMRRVLDYGVELDFLTKNPARSSVIALAGSEKSDPMPFESWAEVEKVATAAGKHGPLIRFACASGLRPQEWQALRWEDVDLADRRIHVRQTVSNGRIAATGKTDNSLRTVELLARAAEALLTLPRPIGGGIIFKAPRADFIDLHNWREDVWYPALERAGVEKRGPKNTRHTFATLALNTPGVDVEWVSAQLGHADPTVTYRFYFKLLASSRHRSVAALNAALSGEGLKTDSAEASRGEM